MIAMKFQIDHSLQEGLVGGEENFDFVPEFYLQHVNIFIHL